MDKQGLIQQYTSARVLVKDEFILQKCQGKKVLDVGCVGQNKFFTDSRWVHAKIKNVASSLTGVDINMAHLDEFNSLGYRLIHPDELQDSSEKFDVIVMGDVIEHVDNLVEFLNFYQRFLEKDGILLITTPNALSIRQTLNVLLYGAPGINDEHSAILECNTMLELFKRTQLEPKEFYWLHEYSKAAKLSRKIVYSISRLMYGFRRYYAPYFVFTACPREK